MKYDPAIIMDEDNDAYKALLELARRKMRRDKFIHKALDWAFRRQQKEPAYCWYEHCKHTLPSMVDNFRVRCLICGLKMACFDPKDWGHMDKEEYRALIRHGLFHLKEHNLIALL